jgi:hypothetical protein
MVYRTGMIINNKRINRRTTMRTNIKKIAAISLATMFVACGGNLQKSKMLKESPVPETITDIDGNVYHTITIGTQVWLVEYLYCF